MPEIPRHTLYIFAMIYETHSAGTLTPSVGLLEGSSRTVIILRHPPQWRLLL